MDPFERIKSTYPDWGPAFPADWERPTCEELDRIQSAYGVWYPRDFVDFQLTECHATPMGDFAFDNFGWASPGLKPMHNLARIVQGAQQIGVPTALAPFRDDNADIFCCTATGEVVVWDHNSSDLYQTDEDRWPSFVDWLAASFEDKHV